MSVVSSGMRRFFIVANLVALVIGVVAAAVNVWIGPVNVGIWIVPVFIVTSGGFVLVLVYLAEQQIEHQAGRPKSSFFGAIFGERLARFLWAFHAVNFRFVIYALMIFIPAFFLFVTGLLLYASITGSVSPLE